MSHPLAGADFAAVFADVAAPLWTPDWGTHVLVRPVAASGGHDATGIYPLTVFDRGADLAAGVAWLRAQGLVSIGLTPDPLTAPPAQDLARAFGLCMPFKPHFVVDYDQPVRFSKHHRYEVRRALEQVEVAEVDLAAVLDDWIRLYGQLAKRRPVGGLSAFSEAAFARLCAVPGLRTLAARAEGEIVSMHLWLEDEESGTVQSLLAASSDAGYARSAAYAVYDAAVQLFAGARKLNLGGGAGLSGDGDDGLSRFKRGFSNTTVQAHFCGQVLDEAAYAALTGDRTAAAPFPAYRFPSRRDGGAGPASREGQARGFADPRLEA